MRRRRRRVDTKVNGWLREKAMEENENLRVLKLVKLSSAYATTKKVRTE